MAAASTVTSQWRYSRKSVCSDNSGTSCIYVDVVRIEYGVVGFPKSDSLAEQGLLRESTSFHPIA